MKSLEEIALEEDNNLIKEDLLYDDIINKLQEAKQQNVPLNEGIFKAIFGGLTGATAGPTIMKALCKVLGVDERGQFGSLLTSRLVLAALGTHLGWKA
jgi:uncharacterized membrane protein YeaQ/YmgE (transglycosylase-associated protein family)